MFADPVVASMTMLLLCFFGMIVMFVFLARTLSNQSGEMREAFRKQQIFLADLERQFMEMSFTLRKMQGEEGAGGQIAGDATLLGRKDDLLSMLDAAAATKGGLGDDLLPPPAVSRPLAEEYDPAKDPHLFEDPLLSDTSPRIRRPHKRDGR